MPIDWKEVGHITLALMVFGLIGLFLLTLGLAATNQPRDDFRRGSECRRLGASQTECMKFCGARIECVRGVMEGERQ